MTIVNPQEMAQSSLPDQSVTTQPTTDAAAPAPKTLAPDVSTPAPPKPTFWTADQAQKAGTLEPTFGGKIEQLIAASNRAGYPLRIGSGFRSDELQSQLYAQAQKDHPGNAGMWVAPPGHSNHNRGEAVDLGGDTTWAHQHAAEFGLTFPMGWEPWHIEPQGLRAQATPQAYTQGPVGTVNPTQDTALDSSPHEITAAFSNLVSGAWMPGGEGLPAGATSQPGNFNLPSVGGTRAGSIPDIGTGPTSSGTGGGANLPASASQQSFIDQVRPFAEAESKRTGIPAEVMIVQSGIETGWGTSGWWRNNLNPAGIGVTGQAGAGNSFGSIGDAFRAYADHLMGNGEAGQERFVADVKAGASVDQLLTDLEQSPWAAGHYGGNGLNQTYSALNSGGAFATPKPAPTAAPAPASEPMQAVNQRRPT